MQENQHLKRLLPISLQLKFNSFCKCEDTIQTYRSYTAYKSNYYSFQIREEYPDRIMNSFSVIPSPKVTIFCFLVDLSINQSINNIFVHHEFNKRKFQLVGIFFVCYQMAFCSFVATRLCLYFRRHQLTLKDPIES